MERGSDKHSPRVDEELDHETRSLQQGAPVESRVEEHREQEGPGEDQPTPESRLHEEPASLDLDDAEARSDIARYLDPAAFPADRDALLDNAEANNAPEVVLERLQALPAGRTYERLPDVWAALGGTVEHRF
ncbi:MAG TPA: DUF2795 domain-containing protein [Actinomycetota bacterium]|nr:DUF2795 domain-containing protein [Actinomycetota bacterium]